MLLQDILDEAKQQKLHLTHNQRLQFGSIAGKLETFVQAILAANSESISSDAKEQIDKQVKWTTKYFNEFVALQDAVEAFCFAGPWTCSTLPAGEQATRWRALCVAAGINPDEVSEKWPKTPATTQ